MSDEPYIPKDETARKLVELAQQIIDTMKAEIKLNDDAEAARQGRNGDKDTNTPKGRPA
jgi:hypothetical protein